MKSKWLWWTGLIAASALTACSHAEKRAPSSAPDEVLFESRDLLPEGSLVRNADGPEFDTQGNLYIASPNKKGSIGVLKAGSSEVTVLFDLPEGGASAGMRMSRQGHLYICDYVKHRIHRYDPLTGSLTTFVERPEMNQPNDVAITADGTLYVSDPSWHSKKPGYLWKVSPSGEVTRVLSGVRAINGIELSPDESKLYFTESISGALLVLDLGAPADEGPRRLYKFEPDTVDGIRTDKNGVIYVARIKAGSVDRVSPEGVLLSRIWMKGKDPTNLTFGGPDGRTVVVTVRDRKNAEVFRADQSAR